MFNASPEVAKANELAVLAGMLRAGRTREALPRLQAITAGSKSVGPAHGLMLEALLSSGDRRGAVSALNAALALPAGSADAIEMLAFVARQVDDHETSRELYRRAAEAGPHQARNWYNLATSERALGDLSAAERACSRALSLDPTLRSALLLRSEVSRATPMRNNIDDLRARISARPDASDTMFLLFALGKELHEVERYDEALEAFSRGAALRRRDLSYDVSMDVAKMRRIAEVYATVPKIPRAGSSPRHVFIVGLPRSGTTLVERILGGLAGVRSNGETNNFATALQVSSPDAGGDVFQRAAMADPTRVRREYERLSGAGGEPGVIIEKLPFNYLYLGAIASALPDAAIVSVERHPVDSCFAMFRTLFASAYPFSYDFRDLARYYAAYRDLMDHWKRLLPDRLHSLDYDDLVADPANAARALSTRIGLTWDESALDIASNRTASLTASAAQVRDGISKRSSGIWRAYGSGLQPLVKALEDAGVVA